MTISVRRWLLLILAAIAAYVGAWALLAPAAWYDTFPGAGHHWLPILGAYNEHLARDVGGLYLALAALSVGAAARAADGYLVRLAAIAWLVFSVPHLVYHLGHLGVYAGLDRAGNAVSLSVVVLLGVALLIPVRTRDTAAVAG
ncbi:MAG TPA: hypothetical protein VGP57_16040 [Actinoplanes sp.]|jgi:hypothetical protein|nr:hypothetical protein [Actinoplanes sp.]